MFISKKERELIEKVEPLKTRMVHYKSLLAMCLVVVFASLGSFFFNFSKIWEVPNFYGFSIIILIGIPLAIFTFHVVRTILLENIAVEKFVLGNINHLTQ